MPTVLAALERARQRSRCGPVSGVVRKRSTRCWSAPGRMQKASASASRAVVVGNVSDPVSSWMPSANRVASSGVTAMPALGDDAQHQRDERPVVAT